MQQCGVSMVLILIDCTLQTRSQFPIDAIDSLYWPVDGILGAGIGTELIVPQEPLQDLREMSGSN